MFRTVKTFAYAFGLMIKKYPKDGKALVKATEEGRIKDAEKIIVPIITEAMKGVNKRAGFEIEVDGEDRIPMDGPFVMVCNHQSYFDVCALLSIVGTKRRFGVIAKKEVKKVGPLAKWMKGIGCVFIDREHPREAIKAIDESIKVLEGGTPMAFFPEGTRSKSSEVGPFKTGVFKIVQAVKPIVIPISIEGTYLAMEANGNKIKPAKCKVVIGEPIDTKDYTREDFKALPNKLRDIIIENKG